MDQRAKVLWCNALRSGLWNPGTDGFLHVTHHDVGRPGLDTFSASGVLCYVAFADGVLPPPRHQRIDDETSFAVFEGASTQMPDSVRQWAVLRGPDPLTGRGRLSQLTANGIDFITQSNLIWSDV